MFRFLKSIGQEMKEVDWPNFSPVIDMIRQR